MTVDDSMSTAALFIAVVDFMQQQNMIVGSVLQPLAALSTVQAWFNSWEWS